MADRVLEEKAARYGLVMNLGGLRAQGSSSSNFFYFGRTPKREYYDYSGGGLGDSPEGNTVSHVQCPGVYREGDRHSLGANGGKQWQQ